MQWYVLQVKGGEELNVMSILKRYNIPALVPRENRLIRQAGKWIEKEYILFPNYVFIHIDFSADNYYRITSIPSVMRFLGNENDPSYLTFIEAEWISILSNKGIPIEPTSIEMLEDGSFKILDGILSYFKSYVKEINKRQKRAKCKITICNEVKQITLSVNIVNEVSNKETEETDVIEK